MARKIETQPRKKMTRRGFTDGEWHTGSDSGCREATLHIGHSSLCLECPFPECKLDKVKRLRSPWAEHD